LNRLQFGAWVCLGTIQYLEEKQTILRGLDEEIINTCPLEEVERETIEVEEISELIVESIEQIKIVIETESGMRKESSSSAHESFEFIIM